MVTKKGLKVIRRRKSWIMEQKTETLKDEMILTVVRGNFWDSDGQIRCKNLIFFFFLANNSSIYSSVDNHQQQHSDHPNRCRHHRCLFHFFFAFFKMQQQLNKSFSFKINPNKKKKKRTGKMIIKKSKAFSATIYK